VTPLLQLFQKWFTSGGCYNQCGALVQWKKWWGTSINGSAIFVELLQSIVAL